MEQVMDMTRTDKPLSDLRNHDREVGLRARLDLAIERALEDRRIVGTVVLVAKGGDIVYGRAAGFADREAGRSMQENCIFLLSSVAKPIVTAAALRLVENGRMSLGDSVRRWLPEFKPRLPDGRVPEITIHHLLTHSAGLTYVFMEPDDGPYHRLRISNGFDRTDADLDEIVRRIAAAPLSYEPGAGWGYSMAIDVLGAVIEKATLRPLPQAVAELVLNPLDMKDTGFAVVDTRRLVVHYADGQPEPRRMADDDRVNFFERPVAFSPGSASGSEGVSIRRSWDGRNGERCPEVPGNAAGGRTAATTDTERHVQGPGPYARTSRGTGLGVRLRRCRSC